MGTPIHTPGADVPQLTGVRAIAAGLVLFLHLDQQYGHFIETWLPPVAKGYLGVDIFFILSGLIISHVYGNSSSASTVRGYTKFIWYRAARLYPMHILTLAGLFFMVAIRGLLDTNFWQMDTILYHLLMLHAWQEELTWNLPAWSISAEWAAYLVFPCFAFVVLKLRNPLFSLSVVIALFVLFELVVVQNGVARSFLGVAAAVRISAEFAFGVLLYRGVQSLKPSIWYDLVAVLAFMAVFFVPEIPALAQILLLGVFVGALTMVNGPMKAFLSNRLMVLLGHASYAVYMVHFPVIKVIQNFNAYFGFESPDRVTAQLLVVSWAFFITILSVFLYRAYERPVQRLMRKTCPIGPRVKNTPR